MRRLRVEIERRVQCPFQRFGIESLEHHAGALAVRGVIGHDRVGKSARLAHDRHGAIAQAVHLVEAARFIQRRHHEHVASRFDEMRKLVVVAAREAHAPRIIGLQLLEEALVFRFATAEHDEPEIAPVQ